MSNSKHIVCPSCNSTNRLPADRLAAGPKCGKCGEQIFVGRPTELTDQNVHKHVDRSDIPVVVDSIFAVSQPWCFSEMAKKLLVSRAPSVLPISCAG